VRPHLPRERFQPSPGAFGCGLAIRVPQRNRCGLSPRWNTQQTHSQTYSNCLCTNDGLGNWTGKRLDSHGASVSASPVQRRRTTSTLPVATTSCPAVRIVRYQRQHVLHASLRGRLRRDPQRVQDGVLRRNIAKVHRTRNSNLAFATRKRIALQFLYGLNYIHSQGFLHRRRCGSGCPATLNISEASATKTFSASMRSRLASARVTSNAVVDGSGSSPEHAGFRSAERAALFPNGPYLPYVGPRPTRPIQANPGGWGGWATRAGND